MSEKRQMCDDWMSPDLKKLTTKHLRNEAIMNISFVVALAVGTLAFIGYLLAPFFGF